MENIFTNDIHIEFETEDSYTKEGTEHLTINISNKITDEDISIWLMPNEVKELIKQLQSWVDG